MNKKVLFILVFYIIITGVIFGEMIMKLPGLMKPNPTFYMDENQIYITENAAIYIYSKKTHKLIKKFGKAGEGPKEFKVIPQVPLTITLKADTIIINSLFKVSYFTKSGDFIREIKAPSQGFLYQPFGDRFIGMSNSTHDKKSYNTFNFYDSKLNKKKEIYRTLNSFQGPGKGLLAITNFSMCMAYEDKLILTPGEIENTINLLDKDLKKKHQIKINQAKIIVDNDFKIRFMTELKSNPATKDILNFLKPIKYPKYFPAIMAYFAEDEIIYVMTYKKTKGNYEFFTYDLKGKFLKKTSIPIKFQTELTPFPITIYKKKLYQIFENEDEEVWELHMNDIK